MAAGRKHLPELSKPDPALCATDNSPLPAEKPVPALQTVAGATPNPARTPAFAQALSYRKRQFIQRKLRSQPNARSKVR